ncbi:MAG: cell division protein FtsL [Burkholderiaceae bacterium]
MRRLSVLLSALLVLCALGLVASQHRARMLFVKMERANALAQKLDSHRDELEIQQTQLAKASLIDDKARNLLKMRERIPQRTMHLLMDEETLNAAHEASVRWRAAALEQGLRK